MALDTMDKVLNRAVTGYTRIVQFKTENQAVLVRPVALAHYVHRVGQYTIPTMETGVTKYIPSGAWCQVGTNLGCNLIITREVLMGTLVIPSTFTDGAALGNITECGVSRQEVLPLLVECTVAMGGTAGTLSITYTDQDGNTAAAPTQAMTNANIGNAQFFRLNAGDRGASDVTTSAVTGGTAPTGTIKIWGIDILAMLPPTLVGHSQLEPFIGALMNVRRLSAGDLVGFWRIQAATTVAAMAGGLCFVGDEA